MKMRRKLRDPCKALDRLGGHHLGRKRAETDPLNVGLARQIREKIGKAVAGKIHTVRGGLNSRQNDLARAALDQPLHLADDVLPWL